MENVVSSLSRLKPWLLFVLTTAPMLVAMLLYFPPLEPPTELQSLQSAFTRMMLISMPGYLVFYAWIFTVGIVCNRSLESSLRNLQVSG